MKNDASICVYHSGVKKELQVAEKRPSPHLVRMRKERDTVLVELKRLGSLNEKLKAERQRMEKKRL